MKGSVVLPNIHLPVSSQMVNFRFDSVIFPVLDRAIRNCPLSASIWAHYITASGALQTSDELQGKKSICRVSTLLHISFVTHPHL